MFNLIVKGHIYIATLAMLFGKKFVPSPLYPFMEL